MVEETQDGAARSRDAFISYSQRQDNELAKALQRGLERLARPRWHLTRMSVFRDVTSLSAHHDLWDSLRRELTRSRYLILLASPEAAASPWVAKELDFWLRERSTEHLLVAVARGDIRWDERTGDFDWAHTTALPRRLAGRFTAEPLWVDLREITDDTHRSLRYAAFRGAVAALAAPLHGRPKEELESDDIRQVRFTRRLGQALIAVLTVLLVLVSGAFLYALDQRDEAVEQARTSASQALAARSGQLLDSSPNQAAQYALYADAARSTPESTRALARSVAATAYAQRRLRADAESVKGIGGAGNVPASEVAFSPDGETIAYYSDFDESQGVRVYDARSARERRLLPVQRSWPLSGGGLALSGSGGLLAMEVGVNRVQLWDTRTAKLLRTVATAGEAELDELPNALYGLQAFALSADGKWLAAAHHTPEGRKFLVVWRVADGAEIARRETGAGPLGVGFGTDGSRLVVVDSTRQEVREFTPGDRRWSAGRPLPGLARDPVANRGIRLYAGGTRALVPGASGAQIWDLNRGRRVATGSLGAYADLSLAADGERLAVSRANGVIGLYDVSDTAVRPGDTVGRLARQSSVALSADGTRVAVASYGGELTLFTPGVRNGEQVTLGGRKFMAGGLTTDGRLLARRTADRTEFWDPRTGRRLGEVAYTKEDGDYDRTAYALSGDKKNVAVMSEGHLGIWSLPSGRRTDCRQTLASHLSDRLVRQTIAYLPGDRYLVAVWDAGVMLLDTRTCLVSPVRDRMGRTFTDGPSLVLSGDRKTLVLVYEHTGEIDALRWDGTGAFLQTSHHRLPADATAVGVGVDHGGTLVAVSDYEGHVYFVELASGAQVRGSGSLNGVLYDIVLSRDGRLAVQGFRTAEEAFGLRVWDVRTGDLLDVWTMDPGAGAAQRDDGVQVAPGPGADLLSIGPDQKVVRRTVGVREWHDRLCALVSQPLPEGDRARYLGDLDVAAPCP